MRILNTVTALAVAASLVLGAAACEKKEQGPAEKLGAKLDAAASDAKAAADKAKEDIEKAAENVKKDLE